METPWRSSSTSDPLSAVALVLGVIAIVVSVGLGVAFLVHAVLPLLHPPCAAAYWPLCLHG
jgi:hypothetical protein